MKSRLFWISYWESGCQTVRPCVLSIEDAPLSDREIPKIRKKHAESFRFFPYLVGKKATFTAFCSIG